MKLPKRIKEKVREVNNQLNEWQNIGYEPSDVKMARHELELFYEWADKNVKNPEVANNRIKLTKDEQEEYELILDSILDSPIGVSEYFEHEQLERWENVKDSPKLKALGITNINEWIKFYESKNRFKQDKLLSSIITWYEMHELVQSIQYSGMSEQEVKDKILEVYTNTGYTGEELYDFVLRNI